MAMKSSISETKVTYLLDLKVIDYTEDYESTIEKKKTVYNPGLNPRYSNKRHKVQQRKLEEEVLDSVTYIEVLEESLVDFKAGNYKNTLDNFAIILKEHPEELNARFYGGLAWFEMGKYKKALRNFNFVIEHPINVFNPESEWYKAQTLLKMGQAEQAGKVLIKIIEEKGVYAEKASALLKETGP